MVRHLGGLEAVVKVLDLEPITPDLLEAIVALVPPSLRLECPQCGPIIGLRPLLHQEWCEHRMRPPDADDPAS